MAEFNFKADGIDTSKISGGDRDLLPKGKYEVVITKSGWKDTQAKKDGDPDGGSFLEFELQVIDGPYQKRRLWHKMNLDNRSEKAVDIAKRELASALKALGLREITDTEELHDQPLMALVGVDGKWNNVYGYEACKPNVDAIAARQPARTRDVSKIGSAGGKGYTVNEPAKGKPKPQHNQAAWDAEHGDGKAQPKTPEAFGLDDDIPF